MAELKWALVPASEAEAERCAARPSLRSTARCEMPLAHRGVPVAAGFHCGRTRGGYWKSWPVLDRQEGSA
jgi:hypothetical protein